ncbi:MAG TPA: AraC family transcriptional regulator, partial [Herpetosiphonaceae bacterium]|nr:AraC family transcriptional regulator [Herpetosiphonaceae bacterium]
RQRLAALDGVWRTFPRHYLLYAADGAFRLAQGEAEWLLPPQRAAWIAAGLPIQISSAAPVSCASVLYAPAALPGFPFSCRVFTVSPLAREMIQYAMRWDDPDGPSDAAAERFFGALAGVCFELAAQPDRFWLPRARSAELGRALEWMRPRLAERISLAEAAAAAGVSERTLARRLSAETGMSWRQLLHRARMIAAMERLAGQERQIIEVAYEVGYESVSAFTTAFRQFAGETPSAYRGHFARG